MLKLLLADDSVTIQRVIELTFSGEDIQVVSVSDGEQAIARIPLERPDIVLADIGMPKRSGYEVAAFVKGHPEYAHIPVLLLAGAFEPVDQSRADQARSDGVLVKPFEPQQVVARVRALLDGARERTVPVSGVASAEPPFPAPRIVEDAHVIEIPDVQAGDDHGGSLDEYFDRLDAAFASLGAGPGGSSPASPVLDDLAAHVDVPTIDELLGGAPMPGVGPELSAIARMAAPPLEPPDAPPTIAPAPRVVNVNAADIAAAPTGRNAIADAFNALLAVEQGEPGAVRLPSVSATPVVTDELVDEVTRRVLQRLAPDAAREIVARIVSEVAERLVRDEIVRIRGRA